MINFLLGSSGSGKSYEANVFHILSDLQAGRKVITNLPVNVDAYADMVPGSRALLEVRTKSRGPDRIAVDDATGKKIAEPAQVFSRIEDYGDTWRNEKGQGPRYVIDECHKSLPVGATDRSVEEWFAEHRHENADVLLITQSYGKISKAIRDNVQIVYRVRKAVALGFMNKYVRKVQDGLRGEVVNETVRTYDKRYFKLYTSHTKGVAAEELNAGDVRPIWQHWSFIGCGVAFVLMLLLLFNGKASVNPMKSATASLPPGHAASKPVAAPAAPGKASAPRQLAAAPQAAAPPPLVASEPEPDPEPYAGRQLHLVGVMRNAQKVVWSFVLSQNGMPVAYLSDADLRQAGYVWNPKHDCAGIMVWKGKGRPVICDLPTVGITVPVGSSSS